jgi:hypothetical protein
MLMFSDSVWDMMSRRYKIRREHPATAAGVRLETRPKSTLANLCDPAGNGVDLVQANK